MDQYEWFYSAVLSKYEAGSAPVVYSRDGLKAITSWDFDVPIFLRQPMADHSKSIYPVLQ